jgi:hypothetical protein
VETVERNRLESHSLFLSFDPRSFAAIRANPRF